jgi:tRNA pseudouridine55 synthase
MDGLLLVDKPAGWTSHDAVAYIRKTLWIKRVGHTGTLDPDATGLILVLLGKATRLARYFDLDKKGYSAVMELGSETDTEDASGQITMECPVPELEQGSVEDVFRGFTGEIEQVPPMYSALKVGGERLYKKARAGEDVERAPRKVFIEELRLTGIEGSLVSFEAVCSKGTYIRTLCRDMGKALGSCAHMKSLRRTKVGDYLVRDALGLHDRPSKEEIAAHIIPMRDMLQGVVSAVVAGVAASGIMNGISPGPDGFIAIPEGLVSGQPVRLLDESGSLLAVGESSEDIEPGVAPVRLKVVFN